MRTLFLFASCLIATLGQCPDGGWTILDDKRRCFKMFTIPLAYPDAQLYCRTLLFGSLGSVYNMYDVLYYYRQLRLYMSPSISLFWIGLHKPPLSSNYIWDNGAAFNGSKYWKEAPKTGSSSDCVLMDVSAGEWLPGNQCQKANAFVCEVAAIDFCKFEDLLVEKSKEQTMETEGARKRQTISTYNCTKHVYVRGNAYIFVRVKVYASPNASLRFIDTNLGKEIKLFAGGEQWSDVEFNTNTNSLRVEGFAERNGKLGYVINFLYLPKICTFETVRAGWTDDLLYLGPTVQSDLYNSTLSNYYCAKEAYAASGHNVFMILTAFVSTDAYIYVRDAKTREILARFENINEWFTTTFHTSSERVFIEANSTSEGRVAFSYVLETVMTSCPKATYTATTTGANIQTYDYPKELYNYTCIRQFRAGSNSKMKLYFELEAYLRGDGTLLLKDLDTGLYIKEFSSLRPQRSLTSFAQTLPARNVELYGRSTRYGSMAYRLLFKLVS